MIRFKLKQVIANREFGMKQRLMLKDIAEATGVSRIILSKMINHHDHNFSCESIDRLCTYFDCRIEDLMEHEKTAKAKAIKKQRAKGIQK